MLYIPFVRMPTACTTVYFLLLGCIIVYWSVNSVVKATTTVDGTSIPSSTLSSLPSLTPYIPTREEHDQRITAFLQWFTSPLIQGIHPYVTLQYYGPLMGYGVEATQFVQDKQILVRLPLTSVICGATLMNISDANIRTVWEYVRDDSDRIALWLMRERARGIYSAMLNTNRTDLSDRTGTATVNTDGTISSTATDYYWSYINVLPRTVSIPAVWANNEIQELQDLRAIDEAKDLQNQLIYRYNHLIPAIREIFRDIPLDVANTAYAAHELHISMEEAKRIGFGESSSGTAPTSSSSNGPNNARSTYFFPTASPVPLTNRDNLDYVFGKLSDGVLPKVSSSKRPANDIQSNVDDDQSSSSSGGTVKKPNEHPGIDKSSTKGLPGFGTSHDSLQSFIWAATLVESRALTIRGRKYLVPFADMMNYSPAPGAIHRNKDNGANFLRYHHLQMAPNPKGSPSTAVTGNFTVYIDRAVAPQHEIHEDYGDNDGNIYLHHHGMIPLDITLSTNPSMNTYTTTITNTNPFDCLYLSGLPMMKGSSPKGSLLMKRRLLAQALGYSPQRINYTCVSPPPTVSTTGTKTGTVVPDPIPLIIHRWLDISTMTMEELSSSFCEQIVKQTEEDIKNDKSNGYDIQSSVTESMIKACFREPMDDNTDIHETNSASSIMQERRNRIIKFIRKILSSMTTSMQDDEKGLINLKHQYHDYPNPLSSSVSSFPVPKLPGSLNWINNTRSEVSWLILSYRYTRKRMLWSILHYYTRTGPFSYIGKGKGSDTDDVDNVGHMHHESVTNLIKSDGDENLGRELSNGIETNADGNTLLSASAASIRTPLPTASASVSSSTDSSKENVAPTVVAVSSSPTVSSSSSSTVSDGTSISSTPSISPSATSLPSAAASSITTTSTAMVQIGLVQMSVRDAAAYFTENEYADVLNQCEIFNNWLLSFRPAVAHIRAAPVGGGMRLGAVTVEPLKREDIYLAIPTEAIMDIQSAKTCPVLGPVLQKIHQRFPDGDEFHELVFHVITEYYWKRPLGNTSSFTPYINLLPDPDHMLFPVLYTDEELDTLDTSFLLNAIRRYNSDIGRKYHAVKREIFDRYSEYFPSTIFNLTTYTWATAILDSRSIWWGGKRHLVPLLDLINCAEGPDPRRVHATRLDARGEYAVTRADRDYEAGEQLWENYGQPNWIYFHFHGFSLLKNSHDCVRIDLFPPTNVRDALVQETSSAASRNRNSKAAKSIESEALPFIPDYYTIVQQFWESSGIPSLQSLIPVLEWKRNQSIANNVSVQERRNALYRTADPRTGALENCIAVSTVPSSSTTSSVTYSLHSETEEAIRFIQMGWSTDRVGALLLLRGLSGIHLRTYRTTLYEDVYTLLQDSAAQVVLGLASEEDAAPQIEALLHYVYGNTYNTSESYTPVTNVSSTSTENNQTPHYTFDTWQRTVLHLLKNMDTAKQVLLPPRIRSIKQYLVTEKVQLQLIAGLDYRSKYSTYDKDIQTNLRNYERLQQKKNE